MLETKKEKEWAKQEVEWMREGVKKAIEAAREAKKELGEVSPHPPIEDVSITLTTRPTCASAPGCGLRDHDI